MRIRIQFFLHGADPVPDFFDANPESLFSNCSPFYDGIYYFIRKGDGRGQGQALFSQPWGLDDPIYVSTVFYFIYVLFDR